MYIVEKRKIFFAISAVFVLLAVLSVLVKGIHWGIDFTGGSAVQIEYVDIERPALSDVRTTLKDAGFGHVDVRPFGETGFMLQMQDLSTTTHAQIHAVLSNGDPAVVMAPANFIGPSIGAELRSKALIAISIVVGAILLFMAYAFRESSEKVSSWKYGIVAIIALIHDIIIPTGIASFLGIEIGSLFVIALLAILGLSISDTIVVFDRVRENARLKKNGDFEKIVGKSLEQTFIRSINTSATVVFVLLTLYVFGPSSTKDFALILALGMAFGTYSSIFLASPLLVEAEKIQRKQDLARKD